MLNSDKPVKQFKDIYANNIENITEVYQRFEKNINERERIMNKSENEDKEKNENEKKRKISPCDPDSDPLYTG